MRNPGRVTAKVRRRVIEGDGWGARPAPPINGLPLCVPYKILLREHLEDLGVKIEYGIEVKSINERPADLVVTLEAGGRTENLAAAYVLGAGGAHSVPRYSMQQHLDGMSYDGQEFIVAPAKLSLPFPPECGRVIVGPSDF